MTERKVGGAPWPRGWRVLVTVAALAGGAAPGGAQDLADYDYENLSFRGVAIEWGFQQPSRLEAAHGIGARVDLGFLGPRVRIMPTIGYFSSDFERGEIRDLEDRVSRLIAPASDPPGRVDFGEIEWSDFKIGVDSHLVQPIARDFLLYGGFGLAIHVLDGDGDAINGTFVGDLLDRVTPGVSVQGGVERPLGTRLRVYSQAQYEILDDLRYFQVRTGLGFAVGSGGGSDR